jgi:nucleotide-binding universal stress UspA family protein
LGALLYQKILVPIDGSDHSKRALSEAIRIAKMTNGNITLLNVQSNRSRIAPANQAITDAKNSIVLNDGSRLVKAEGVPVETLLLEGSVIDQIVKTAKDGNFDLIVVGARGLSKFEELLLGSVSHGVVENSPCPVIVTR